MLSARLASIGVRVLGLCLIAACYLTPPHSLADWPTYLHDNSRAGATEEPLSADLHLQWRRLSAAPPRKAWEGPRDTPIEGKVMKHRVAFDDAHHVVAAKGRAYYGSIVNHHLTCMDSRTGRTLWTFAAEGPIRLAPTLAGDRILFGSDDGRVYCLSASTGKPIWNLRVGPRDERLLARGKMISRWPVRTGVLVDGNVAYFGAGIFPHENIYLAAARVDNGKLIWKNDSVSQRNAGRNDISPQGYLLANKNLLFVPSGRSLPAAFNRNTGEYEYKRTYGWRSTAGGVVGGAKALLSDGQLFSFGPHHMLALDERSGDAGYAYIGGRQMTFKAGSAFIANGKEIIAVDREKHAAASRARQKLFIERRKHRSNRKKVAEITRKMEEYAQVGIRWRSSFSGDSALIRTANLLIGGAIGEVAAWDLQTGKQVWSAEIDGEARGLAVADGTLFVSSTSGSIYAFAARKSPTTAVDIPTQTTKSPYPKDARAETYRNAARSILQKTGVRRGFCLVLGAEHGQLAYELARQSQLQIYGVEPDDQKLRDARKRLFNAGLYGTRITLFKSRADTTPLSNYFANLVVSDRLLQSGTAPTTAVQLGRYVKPCGGLVCFGAPGKKNPNEIAKMLQETYLRDDAEITSQGDWAILRRGKLPGVGEWSHQYGNVGNTSFSKDYRVKGSLGVLWYGDPGPSQMINRHEAASAPLTTNGRFFVQGTDSVRAYDAYNGLFLWEYKNPGAIRTGVFNNHETSNLAANDDSLFVVVKDECTELDAQSGKVRRRHRAPQSADGIPRHWGYVAVHKNVLYGTSTIRSELARSLRRRGRTVGSTTSAIFAIDLETGKKLWDYEGPNIMHVTIALGEGNVYFVESSISQSEREALLRQDKSKLKELRGAAAKAKEAELKKIDVRRAVCLAQKTGVKRWAKAIDVTNVSGVSAGGGNICLMVHDGHVVIAGANANGHYWRQFLSGQFSKRRLLVLDARTGAKQWSKDANYMNRPVVVGDQVVAEPWSFHIATGKERTRIHPLTGVETKWQFSRPGHHCGIITATPNMMLFRSGFIGYYDLYADSGTRHFAGQRLGCWVNAIPGNGLVVIPEASAGCVCLFSITSTVVLEPREDRDAAWGIYSAAGSATPVKRLAINLGAPGDRRDSFGNLWLSFPRPQTRGRMEYVFDIKPKLTNGGKFYAKNSESLTIKKADVPWVMTSGVTGLQKLQIPLRGKQDSPARYTVRLHFAEIASVAPGERRFDIKLQGQTVANDIDLSKAVGQKTALIRKFSGVNVTDHLTLELVSRSKKPPVISGIDLQLEEDQDRP